MWDINFLNSRVSTTCFFLFVCLFAIKQVKGNPIILGVYGDHSFGRGFLGGVFYKKRCVDGFFQTEVLNYVFETVCIRMDRASEKSRWSLKQVVCGTPVHFPHSQPQDWDDASTVHNVTATLSIHFCSTTCNYLFHSSVVGPWDPRPRPRRNSLWGPSCLLALNLIFWALAGWLALEGDRGQWPSTTCTSLGKPSVD